MKKIIIDAIKGIKFVPYTDKDNINQKKTKPLNNGVCLYINNNKTNYGKQRIYIS